jgi:hypothetical protein
MARTKDALNKRTRLALSAAAEGKLASGAEQTLAYLVGIVQDDRMLGQSYFLTQFSTMKAHCSPLVSSPPVRP